MTTKATTSQPVRSTTKQHALLRKLGYTGTPESLDLGQASATIDAMIAATKDARERIKAGVDLIDFCGRYTELRKESRDEYSGACPMCGGNDRFHCKKDIWFCRQCYPHDNGLPHDAVAFVMHRERIEEHKAIAALSGGTLALPVAITKPSVKQVSKANKWNEPKRRAEVLANHSALVDGKVSQAQACMAYLESRGINKTAINVFKLGVRSIHPPAAFDYEKKEESHPMQRALVLPWFNHDGALMCIKYRFLESHTYTDIESKERTENKTSRGSPIGQAFGWQALQGPDFCPVLIITEGEINALSIWQASGGLADVLSTGSESTTPTLPASVIEIAKQYKHKIVWADKGNIADAAALSIGAASMRSPNGQDANDMLRAGKLAKKLSLMFDKLGVERPAAPIEAPTVAPAALVIKLDALSDTDRPPLPRHLWQSGIADYGQAWRVWQELRKDYFAAMGKHESGYYINDTITSGFIE